MVKRYDIFLVMCEDLDNLFMSLITYLSDRGTIIQFIRNDTIMAITKPPIALTMVRESDLSLTDFNFVSNVNLVIRLIPRYPGEIIAIIGGNSRKKNNKMMRRSGHYHERYYLKCNKRLSSMNDGDVIKLIEDSRKSYIDDQIDDIPTDFDVRQISLTFIVSCLPDWKTGVSEAKYLSFLVPREDEIIIPKLFYDLNDVYYFSNIDIVCSKIKKLASIETKIRTLSIALTTNDFYLHDSVRRLLHMTGLYLNKKGYNLKLYHINRIK